MDNIKVEIKELKKYFEDLLGPENVKTNEPMSKHTTFKTGGPAWYYLTPENGEQIAKIIDLCNKTGVKYHMHGNGSNVLFDDEGYDGVIIATCDNMTELIRDNNVLVAGAGVTLARLAKEALDGELTGLEFASGIPGTVGGAVVMNAGAYGGEIRHVIVTATVYDCESKEVKILGNKELCLEYRKSIIMEKPYIVLEACFELCHGDKDDIKETMNDYNSRRREKQPLNYASAGSTFKRPEGYFAGALIEECGLKGYRVNDAMVSEKHAGFVVNTGNATTKDILGVIKHVQEMVYEIKKVKLEPEVRIIKK